MLSVVLAMVPPCKRTLAEALTVPAVSVAVPVMMSWAFVVMLLTETFAPAI